MTSCGFLSNGLFQLLTGVPRLWTPAVRCPECLYPNDTGFKFCQRCGHKRKVTSPKDSPVKVEVDMWAIDRRLESLRSTFLSKPYQRQKDSLLQEFENFLFSLPTSKSLFNASPRDVRSFLVWKDSKGKTKVHRPSCRLFGSTRKGRCACPTTLAAGTVDNLIGKLRTIFTEAGRGGEWNEALGIGNPAAHHSVKQYLTLLQEEQAQARITPKQAVPLFFDKLSRLCTFLREQIFVSQASPT